MSAQRAIEILPPAQQARELFAHEPGQARARILALEAAMRVEIDKGAMVENTRAMPLEHMFIPARAGRQGSYARSLTIPAGTLIVGKIHKEPCFNFVERGEISVLTEEGEKTITAPAFFPSAAGVKRVGLAHSDTVWITVHVTDLTDLAALERELTADSYEDYQLYAPAPCAVLDEGART